MIAFLMFSGILLLFLGLPVSVIVVIIFLARKKKVLIPAICIPVTLGIGLIAIGVGGYFYGQTDEYQQLKTEQALMEQTEKEQAEKEQAENETSKKENKKQEQANEIVKDEQSKKELTETEYKALCKEIYNDEVFKGTVANGTKVKIRVMVSEKHDYSPTSMQGILVEKITEKYNLETHCLGCTVMHESTKNAPTPSYFGKQIYIMFQENSVLNIDTFITGQKIIIYGEIIQNTNGHYVLPKYYEEG